MHYSDSIRYFLPGWELRPMLFLLLTIPWFGWAEDTAPNRWEKDIRQFEEQDRAHPPEKGGVLFLGSSTIRMWDLKKYFPKLPAINRGFGGSTFADVNCFRERLVTPYAPKTIVLYAGDNDIAQGESPERVFDTFKQFADWLTTQCPDTRLIVISIKPSPARWPLWDAMQQANRKIREYLETTNGMFLDCSSAMLGPDGRPQKALYIQDGLHLSPAGYARWAELLNPLLDAKKP